jgi:choline dehydrogenase-like flavoprotein
MEFDFVVIGAGSAGCAIASVLADAKGGTFGVLEAGPSDAVPQVKIPFGPLYTMGGRRDWNFRSTAQENSANRNLKVNRGRMLGGSSPINSMVWFRGRQDDFDNWNLPGWAWKDVEQDFEEIEAPISHAGFLILMTSQKLLAYLLAQMGWHPQRRNVKAQVFYTPICETVAVGSQQTRSYGLRKRQADVKF